MATTTTPSKKINDFTEGFGESVERYRAINEKLVETGKKTAYAALDGYEKTVAGYVEFRQQLAEATQLDWVTTVVKAQNEFLSEVNAAYISAARNLLKGYNDEEPAEPAGRVVEEPSEDDIDSHAADRAAGYEDKLEDDEDQEEDLEDDENPTYRETYTINRPRTRTSRSDQKRTPTATTSPRSQR